MTVLIALILILALSSFAFHLGKRRALSIVSGNRKSLQSLPGHYGFYLALSFSIPTLILFVTWYICEASVLEWLVRISLSSTDLPKDPAKLSLFFSNIRNYTDATLAQGSFDPPLTAAIKYYMSLSRISDWTLGVGVIGLSAAGFTMGWVTISPAFRARVKIEAFVLSLIHI